MNRPSNFCMRVSRSHLEGQGRGTSCMTRWFSSYMVDKRVWKKPMKVVTSIKSFERRMLYYWTSYRGLKFLSNMLLNSACEDNSEGQLAVCFEWPNDYCNKFRHHILVITLIKSIYNDDCGFCPRQTGKNSHCHDRLNNQSFELVHTWLTENRRIILDDISNQQFGGRCRNGQLISQCRDKASDDASVPRPSKK